MKQSTDTSGRNLIPEGNYQATIQKIFRKEPKGFVIYEWSFEALVNDNPFYFKIGMFPSQMGDLLRCLGAIETSPNKFDWDDDDYIGITVSFNLLHVADKKGVIRETLSDIKMLSPRNTSSVTDPGQVQWGN